MNLADGMVFLIGFGKKEKRAGLFDDFSMFGEVYCDGLIIVGKDLLDVLATVINLIVNPGIRNGADGAERLECA